MKYLIALCCLINGISWSLHSRIFPEPEKIQPLKGAYAINGSLLLPSSEDTRAIVNLFHEIFEQELQLHIGVSEKSTVALCKAPNLPAEGYFIEIRPEQIHIEYADQSGLIYAFQTLRQWITSSEIIEAVLIHDAPKFVYRGMHLDCSRHFYTIQELEQVIDQMAALKLNRFHWHLTDDQGWRLEIKQYPKLTAIGAWRDSTVEGHYSKVPRTYEKKRYGGFYTQDEAKKLVQYAAQRGIVVIPEIEMPGHARAAIAAYPELSCTGATMPVEGLWGVFDDVFCSKDYAIDFLKNVLDEVVAIFPSETIHIGGDEAPKVRWKSCTKCKDNLRAHGLKDEHELQRYFIEQMEKHLRQKGRKLMGWDEILEGGLAANAQVMSWRGEEGGIQAAKAGHYVVMTPTSHCYFDYYQSSHPDEPLAIGGYLPLEKVYNYNPIPQQLTEAEGKFILGTQANIWTEYLPDMNAVNYHTFPRLIALAEVAWSRNKPGYDAFVPAMATHYLPRLTQAGIRFSSAFVDVKMDLKQVPNGLEYRPKSPLNVSCTSDERNSKAVIDRLELERTSEAMVRQFPVTTWYNGTAYRTTNYTYTTHLALGRSIHFLTPPNAKYNVHDSLGLTNGITGSLPWRGDQWLGFSEDTIRFVLDLQTKTDFNTLQLGTLNDPGSWIYRPLEVQVEYSNNGKKFKKCCSIQVNEDRILIRKKMKARYLRFTVINTTEVAEGLPGAGTTPWTFLDELIITR
ncbi:MAG: family 20 glycosylhydrolase [Fluviicola sp.]